MLLLVPVSSLEKEKKKMFSRVLYLLPCQHNDQHGIHPFCLEEAEGYFRHLLCRFNPPCHVCVCDCWCSLQRVSSSLQHIIRTITPPSSLHPLATCYTKRMLGCLRRAEQTISPRRVCIFCHAEKARRQLMQMNRKHLCLQK